MVYANLAPSPKRQPSHKFCSLLLARPVDDSVDDVDKEDGDFSREPSKGDLKPHGFKRRLTNDASCSCRTSPLSVDLVVRRSTRQEQLAEFPGKRLSFQRTKEQALPGSCAFHRHRLREIPGLIHIRARFKGEVRRGMGYLSE